MRAHGYFGFGYCIMDCFQYTVIHGNFEKLFLVLVWLSFYRFLEQPLLGVLFCKIMLGLKILQV